MTWGWGGRLLPGSHHYLEEALPASVTEPTLSLPVLAPAWPRTENNQPGGGDPTAPLPPLPPSPLLSLCASSHNKSLLNETIQRKMSLWLNSDTEQWETPMTNSQCTD